MTRFRRTAQMKNMLRPWLQKTRRSPSNSRRRCFEHLEPRVLLSAEFAPDPYVDLNFTTDWSEAGLTDRGYNVAIQPDGKIVVAGVRAKTIQQNSQDMLVARYNDDGTIDTTFNNGTGFAVATRRHVDTGEEHGWRDTATQIALGSNGEIVVAGGSIDYHVDPGPDESFVARFDSDGNLLGTYSRVGLGTSDLIVLSSGKILALSNVTNPNDFELTRLNPDMTLDTSFGSGGSVRHDALGLDRGNAGWEMAEQSDGKIVVVGQAHIISDEQVVLVGYFARFNADGTLDAGYASNGEGIIDPSENIESFGSIVFDDAGNAYLSGSSTAAEPQLNAVKLNSSGILDSSFGSGGIFRYSIPGQAGGGGGVAIDQNGDLILSGSIDGQTFMIRVDADGQQVDESFAYNGSIVLDAAGDGPTLRGWTIDASNRIVIAGQSVGGGGMDTLLLRIDPQDGVITTTEYGSNDIPKPLKDAKGKNAGKTNSTLEISDSFDMLDLNVQLDITHTRDEDLDVFLISPSGTSVELFSDVGGSGDDFAGTIIDDEAPTPITSGAAPFTGSFESEGLLGAFNGENTFGTWTLRIEDDEKNEVGTLNSWSITVVHAVPPPPAAGITVTPTSGLVTTEGGGTATFDIILDTKPTADVTIGISSGDPTEGSVDLSSVTFTPADWNVAQTVTVTGLDDPDVDGDIGYTILTGLATGAAEYVGIDAADVSVTNTDNEVAAGVTVSGISPNSMSPNTTVNDVTISGSGFAAGAGVTFTNGAGPAPNASNVVVAPDGMSITATVSAHRKAKESAWDVEVTNPDDSTGACVGCFTVSSTASAQSSDTGDSTILLSSESTSSTTSTTDDSTSTEEAATLIDPSFFADESLTDDPVIDDLADGFNDEPIAGDDASLDAAFADLNDGLLTDELVDLLV